MSEPEWRIRYRGTAGFTLQHHQTPLFLDPFVNRPDLVQTGLQRFRPNSELVRSLFRPWTSFSSDIRVTTTPVRTGSLPANTRSIHRLSRRRQWGTDCRLPARQLTETMGREDLSVQGSVVRGVSSRNGKVYFGQTRLAGRIESQPARLPRVWELRHGPVLNWHV